MNEQQNTLQQETDDEDSNCWYEVERSIEENNNKDANFTNNIIATESGMPSCRAKEEAMVCLDIKEENASRNKSHYGDNNLQVKYYIREKIIN